MVLGKMDSHTQKNTSGPLPYTIYKNQMSIRLETIKLVEDYIGGKLLDRF